MVPGPVGRVVPHVVRTVAVATTSRLLRTAMTVRRVVPGAVPGAAIAAVPAVPTRTSRAPTRRDRIIRVRHDLRASRTDKADHRGQAARRAKPATQLNSVAGMYLTASIPAHARHVRAATRTPTAPDPDVPVPVARASRVARATSVVLAHREVRASMPVRTNNVHSRRARKAIVRKAACHAGQTQVRVAMVRKDRVRAAIDRTSHHVVLVVRRRMHVHRAHVRTAPARRGVHADRATKGCRATRIESPPAPAVPRNRGLPRGRSGPVAEL